MADILVQQPITNLSRNDSIRSLKDTTPLKAIGNYTFQQSIGKGSMGKVKLGVHNITGERIAVKIVPRANYQIMNQTMHSGKSIQQIAKEKAREENRETRTIREAHIMMFLKHPNIVKMKDIISQGSYFYILMDFVDGSQLLQYIVKRQRLSERRTKHFTRQIVSALDYLHRNSIVHRDLKIENIMVDKSGKQIKIIDFGLSNLFCPERQLTTYCGSLYFAAPELLCATPYNGPEVDIWSLGVVIYVMITGAVPFDDKSMPGLHDKIKRGHVNYPSYIDEGCKDLLSRIFITDPHQRIIMTDIMHHAWLTQDIGAINNHMPNRKPPNLPLNPKVIERMAVGFDLGTPEEIERRLTLILQSPVYHDAIRHIADCQARKPHPSSSAYNNYIIYDDPQSVPAAYHPFISLYCLAAEKLAAIEHEKHQKRMSIRSTLSRKGSIDSLGGYSSARSSQASLVDEFAGARLLSDMQTPIQGSMLGFEPSASTNYLSRIQRWLRSSLSQHHLDQPQRSDEPKERFHVMRSHSINSHHMREYQHSMRDYQQQIPQQQPSPPPHGSKSLFRKLSHAFLRRKPHEAIPPPVPPKDYLKRYSMPPTNHIPTPIIRYDVPSTPTISRSASLASASFHRRRGSISKLTDKMNTWLTRNPHHLNKTEA